MAPFAEPKFSVSVGILCACSGCFCAQIRARFAVYQDSALCETDPCLACPEVVCVDWKARAIRIIIHRLNDAFIVLKDRGCRLM